GGGDFAEDADGEAGAGEGLAIDDFFGEAELEAELAHFVFEKAYERLDQFELHVLGQAAHVVMALDHRSWIAGDGNGFNDVGIERTLREKFGGAGAFGRGLKNFDESFADDFAFAFGISDAFQAAEEK